MTRPDSTSLGSKALDLWLVAAMLGAGFTCVVQVGDVGRGSGIRFTPGGFMLFGVAAFAVAREGLRAIRRGARRRRLEFSLISLAVGLLLAACVMSVLLSPGASSLKELVQLALFFFIPYAGVRLLVRDAARRRAVAKGLTLAVGAGMALALLQRGSGAPGFLIRGGLADSQAWGLFALIGFPFLAALAAGVLRAAAARAIVTALLSLAFAAALRDTGLALALLVEIGCLWLVGLRLPARVRKAGLLPLVVGVAAAHLFVHPADARRFLQASEFLDADAAYWRREWFAAAGYPPVLELRRGAVAATVRAAALPLRLPEPEAEAPDALDPNTLKQRYAEWWAGLRLLAAHPATGVGLGAYQGRIGRHYGHLVKINAAEPQQQSGWLVLGGSVGVAGLVGLLGALLLGASRVRDASSTDRAPAERRDHGRPANDDLRAAVAAASLGVIVGGFWTPLFQTGTCAPLAALLAMVPSTPLAVAAYHARDHAGPKRSPLLRRMTAAALPALCVLVLLSRLVTTRPAEDVFLWREAEAALEIEPPMAPARDPLASGGRLLEIPESVGTGWLGEKGGRALYEFDMPADGLCNLWARVRWNDGCGNAFFVRVGDGPRRILGNDAEYGRWHWVALREIPVTAGPVRVAIENREDGVALDKILLTSNRRFVPRGAWEMAFSKNPAEKPRIGWVAPEDADDWKVRRTGDLRGLHLDPRPGRPDASPWLLQQAARAPLQIDCRFHLDGPGADCALLFVGGESQDPAGAWRIDFTPQTATLSIPGANEPAATSALPFAIPPGEPMLATVRLREDQIALRLNGREVFRAREGPGERLRAGFGSIQGGASVSLFEVRPLPGGGESHAFDAEPTDRALSHSEPVAVGDSFRAGYDILLDRASAGSPLDVTLHAAGPVEGRVRIAGAPDGFRIDMARDEAPAISQSIPCEPLHDQEFYRVGIRSLAGEIVLFSPDRVLGRAALPDAVTTHGAVLVSPEGLRSVRTRNASRFYDGFGGCDGNNLASWTPLAGQWEIATDAVQGGVDAYMQTGEGAALSLTGEDVWTGYDVACLFRVGAEGRAGVVLHYVDSQRHDLLRWSASTADDGPPPNLQWLRRSGGEEHVVATASAAIQPGQWHELRIERWGPERRRVVLDGRPVMLAPCETEGFGRIGLVTEDAPGALFDNVCVEFF